MFRIVFWDVLPCKIIVGRRFRGAYCLHHRSVDNFYTAVHPRRQFWTSYSPPWELEIAHVLLLFASLWTFLNKHVEDYSHSRVVDGTWGEWLAFLFHIWEVLASNFVPDTNNIDWNLLRFSFVPPRKLRDDTLNHQFRNFFCRHYWNSK
jgi:hypothetical protein